MAQLTKPTVVYHADWGGKQKKRWCAGAGLGTDGSYTAFAPKVVGNLGSLLEQLRTVAGDTRCAFARFDFPIGVPEFYATQAGISSFRALLPKLGCDEWKDFYSVCDDSGHISVQRPSTPDRKYKRRRKEDLFRGHGVKDVLPLLRRCKRGGDGRRQACSLFWTLGCNQVGKAAIICWRDVLASALENITLWSFDGPLSSLLMPGCIVVAETYPAECNRWFPGQPLGSKRNQDDRKKFGASLLRWVDAQSVTLKDGIREEIQGGFPDGEDDAFDAVVGLFGMLQVCLRQREPSERVIRDIEGWILGRESR
jgi:hypothetical protein